MLPKEYYIVEDPEKNFRVMSRVEGTGWSGKPCVFLNFVAEFSSQDEAKALVAKLEKMV